MSTEYFFLQRKTHRKKQTLHGQTLQEEHVLLSYLLFRSIQVLFVLIGAKVSWIRVILHELINMTGCFIENVSAARIGSHVSSADIV